MEVICRFCLKTIEKPLQIDKMVKEIIDILMLKLDLRITPEPVMCYECAETLQTAFDFKSACIYTEDCLYPFIEGKSEPRLDLWEVYLKVNDSKDVESVKGREVCRFCMKPSDSDCCTPIDVIEENVEIKKLLENYLPEVVLGVIEKPVACKNCCNFLHQYSLFVTSFLHIEQQIQSYFKTLGRDCVGEIDLRQVRDFSLSSVTKREAETNGKDKVAKEVVMIFSEIENEEKIVPEEDMECEEKETGESKISMASPEFYGFAESDELFTSNEIPVIEDAQVDVEIKRPFLEPLGTEVTKKYLEEDVIHTEETKGESLKSQRVLSPQKIEECQELEASLGIKLVEFEIKKEDDECDRNENSILSLIDPSMIFSGYADIKPTVADTSYNPEANHTAIESGPDQNASGMNTEYPNGLQVKSVGDVEGTVYRCKICPYKTKRKHHLNDHMLVHKDISEVTAHQCKLCPYKTKRKSDLPKHMLIHKDPSERPTYDCNLCSYKTKIKQCLSKHMPIHEDNPKNAHGTETEKLVEGETIIHWCKLCPYKTKRKSDLTKHMLVHKDSSEITTYDCKFCSYKAKQKGNFKRHMLTHKDNPKEASELETNLQVKGEVEVVEEAIYRCKLCPYKNRSKYNLTRHMLVHKDISKVTAYQCGLCRFKTKRKNDLVKHIKQTHKGSSEDASELETNLQVKSQVEVVEEAIYRCKLCPYETKFKECLDEHTLTHEDNSKNAHGTETEKETIIHRCKLCPYKTKRKSDLTKHMLVHKDSSEITTYDCIFCSYKAKQKGNLKRHMLTHEDNPKDASELETNLQVKSQVEVVEEAIYRCKLCPYETKRKGYLVKHMLVHKDSSEVTTYRCKFCSYETKRKGDVNKHMRNHMDKPKIAREIKTRPPVKLVANKHIYKCKHCPYKTQRKNNFNDHMLVHKDISEVTSYHCLLCPYKSKRKGDLVKHTQSHTDPSERPTYHCYFCSYKAKRKSLLIKHLLIHKDNPKVKSVGKVQETVYRCKLCTHKTKLKYNLARHMLVHKDISEVKLHRCKVCPYKTKRKCNLTQHMLGHKYISKVTTYHCNFCSHEAKCKSSLIKHLLIHKDNPKDAKSALTQQGSMSGKYELEECSTIKSEEVDIKDDEDECEDASNKL